MDKFKCCLCLEEYEGFGNDPFPLCKNDDYEARCCDICNSRYVIPAGMGLLSKKDRVTCASKYNKYLEEIKNEN